MKPCFECGTLTQMSHHVVPVSCGGTKTVPLCHACHRKAHGDSGELMFRPELIVRGIAKVRAEGASWGAPIKVDPLIFAEAQRLRAKGMSYKAIAKKLKLASGTVHRWLNEW